MKNWFTKILGGISLTTALFIFEACYGTPRDMGYDVLVEGQVVSKTTGNPIEGIQVAVDTSSSFQLTDSKGNFSFYTSARSYDKIKLVFRDKDSTINGNFNNLDTFVSQEDRKVNVIIQLQDK